MDMESGSERLASAGRALDKVETGLKLVDTVLKLGEGAGLPLIPAVCSAARGVLQAVQASRTLITDALSAAQRTVDVLELLQLMAANAERMDVKSRASVEHRMRELKLLLEDARLAVAAFGKKGWLRHALKVGRRSTLSQLDSEITGQLDLLLKFYNLARDAHVIDRLQAHEYAVEAEVQRQVAERKAMGEAVDEEALEKDSEVVRGIAVASGVSDAEFRSELRELGAEVREAFEKHGLKLDKVLEQNQKILEQLSLDSVAAQPHRMSLYAYDRKPDAPPGQKDKPAARLGKGSFGVTYRMRKVAGIDARQYAVKMIESEELDGAGLEKEARLLSLLEHENLLRFYDAFWHDTDDGRLFVIVTELLTGGSLADKIVATPPAPPLEVAALMRQAASGLAYVHSLNLQHRDLKPANVMLDSTGRVKIIDFGLACVSSASRSRSRTKVGTAAYMSPEKADGKRYGPPDDVWAAGCILAELLLGRPIGNVARDQTKLKRAIAESKFASAHLGSWVEGCLQETPRRRPAAVVLEQGLASGGPGAQEAKEHRLREAAAAAAAADEKERVRREAVTRSRREKEERSQRKADRSKVKDQRARQVVENKARQKEYAVRTLEKLTEAGTLVPVMVGVTSCRVLGFDFTTVGASLRSPERTATSLAAVERAQARAAAYEEADRQRSFPEMGPKLCRSTDFTAVGALLRSPERTAASLAAVKAAQARAAAYEEADRQAQEAAHAASEAEAARVAAAARDGAAGWRARLAATEKVAEQESLEESARVAAEKAANVVEEEAAGRASSSAVTESSFLRLLAAEKALGVTESRRHLEKVAAASLAPFVPARGYDGNGLGSDQDTATATATPISDDEANTSSATSSLDSTKTWSVWAQRNRAYFNADNQEAIAKATTAVAIAKATIANERRARDPAT